MGRMVKRLSNLEIDEVSLVDRPANQHGLVAIAKAHSQEDSMPDLFDADGTEVFEDELRPGDYVYDGEGQEFQVTADAGPEGSDAYDGSEYEAEEANELAGVGKSVAGLRATARDAGGRGAAFARRKATSYGVAAGAQTRAGAAAARGTEAGQHLSRNRGRYALGAAGAGGAGAGYAGGRRVGKSLGDQVLEELSKAYTDDDRDQVIAKALGRFEDIAKANEALQEQVSELLEAQEFGLFEQVAKGYELPGEEADIAGLLQRASAALPEEDVQALDRFFSAHGAIAKALYEEQGVIGGQESSILDQVYGMAGDVIAKSETGVTQEQAVTAMFDANPDAYDAYEAETRVRG